MVMLLQMQIPSPSPVSRSPSEEAGRIDERCVHGEEPNTVSGRTTHVIAACALLAACDPIVTAFGVPTVGTTSRERTTSVRFRRSATSPSAGAASGFADIGG
jgi:hypothetical protein